MQLLKAIKAYASSKVKNENDAIRNWISDDFDKQYIAQPWTQWTNQPWITGESW